MATGVRIYTSNDASAPQLYGSAGSLTTLLDAVLVNGYGSMAAAGTSPGAGAWTISYTGTNKRIYRPAAGNQFYMRIQDDAGGTGGAKEALIKGSETATGIDTVANPFPATGQSALTSNSLVIRKSATADSITGRPWIVAADDRSFILLIQAGDVANRYDGTLWGDFCSEVSGDGYRSCIIARASENGTGVSPLSQSQSALTSAIGGHYIARTSAGTGTSINNWKGQAFLNNAASVVELLGLIAYPNTAGSSFIALPILLGEISPFIRGRHRGFWFTPHTYASLNDGDTVSGTGALAGKTFRVIKGLSATCLGLIETSDTWDTSS